MKRCTVFVERRSSHVCSMRNMAEQLPNARASNKQLKCGKLQHVGKMRKVHMQTNREESKQRKQMTEKRSQEKEIKPDVMQAFNSILLLDNRQRTYVCMQLCVVVVNAMIAIRRTEPLSAVAATAWRRQPASQTSSLFI